MGRIWKPKFVPDFKFLGVMFELFELKIKKSEPCIPSGKLFPNNSIATISICWENQGIYFLDPENGQITLSEGSNLTRNFKCRGNLSTSRAPNIPKSWPFKAKNIIETTLKQLQSYFGKFQKTTFLASKIVKNSQNKPFWGSKFDPIF